MNEVIELAVHAGAGDQAHGGAAIVAASVDATKGVWVTLRAPLVLASLEQPAGSYVDEGAFGNVELGMELHRVVAPGLGVVTRFGIGVPTARNDDLGFGPKALAFADVLFGRRAPQLFVTGVVPIASGLGLTFERGRWSAHAGASFVRSFFGEVGGAVRLSKVLSAELGVRMFWPVVAVEPALVFRVTPHFAFTLEGTVPVGHGASVGTTIRASF